MESAKPTPAAPAAPAAPQPAPARPGELGGVLFDMDGLLVDSEPLWFEVECTVAERLDGNWSETDQQALIGKRVADRNGIPLAYAAAASSSPVSKSS